MKTLKKFRKVAAVLMAAALVVGIMPQMTANVKAEATVYEAEDGSVCELTVVSGQNSRIRSGDLSNASGNADATVYTYDYVTFTVTADQEGLYDMHINIAANSNPAGTEVEDIPLAISVNGGEDSYLTIANNRNYNSFVIYTTQVYLNEGTNTIKIENACVEEPNMFVGIDYISLEQHKDRYECEDTSICVLNTTNTSTSSGTRYTSRSGFSTLAGMSNNCATIFEGDGITYTIDIETAGTYTMTLCYAVYGTLPGTITVNDNEPIDYTFNNWLASGGNGYITLGTEDVEIELNEGKNTIAFYNLHDSTNTFFINFDYIELALKEAAPDVETRDIIIDGTVVSSVEIGGEYTLPTDAAYGYFDGEALYHGGETVTVDDDLSYTSVNEMSVSMNDGASIRIDDVSGIRFKASITTDNDDILSSGIVSEGTLITAKDLTYEGGDLEFDAPYDVVEVQNDGWYNGAEGTYCASLINMSTVNYNREFVARAYVVLIYADGDEVTVYSNTSAGRSIAYVAQAIIDAGHLGNYSEEAQSRILDYASYL